MERGHVVGPGAVTEFDELFEVGFKSMVASLIESTGRRGPPAKRERWEPLSRKTPPL
jgi:hypothetical protein